jgi:hypothetical protein
MAHLIANDAARVLDPHFVGGLFSMQGLEPHHLANQTQE